MKQPNKRQRDLIDRLVHALDEYPSEPPGMQMLANELHVPIQALEAIIPIAAAQNQVFQIVPGSLRTRGQLTKIIESLRKKFGGKLIHPRDLREFLAATRRWTEPLTIFLTDRGILIREEGGHRLATGDLEALLPASAPEEPQT